MQNPLQKTQINPPILLAKTMTSVIQDKAKIEELLSSKSLFYPELATLVRLLATLPEKSIKRILKRQATVDVIGERVTIIVSRIGKGDNSVKCVQVINSTAPFCVPITGK